MSRPTHKILVVDFDGTLCTTGWPHAGKRLWIHKFITMYIKYKHKQGWLITISTMRNTSKHLEVVYDFINKYNLPITKVNENRDADIIHFGESRKIGGNIVIDDRNMGFIGWLLRCVDRNYQKRRWQHE